MKEKPNPEHQTIRQPQRPQNRPRWLSPADKVVDALHFYCTSSDNWMEMPKTERKDITIDSEATSEIDVSASQLFILYAMNGRRLDYSSDPYSVDQYPREIIKQVIVTMIGQGGVPERWPKDFKASYEQRYGRKPSEDYKLKYVVAAVLEKHPILESLKKGKLDWANLQFQEAECFLSTMLTLLEAQDIPSLPIHDSLIVRRFDKHAAIESLRQAYKGRFGYIPSISIK